MSPELIKKLRLLQEGKNLVLYAPEGYIELLGLTANSASYQEQYAGQYDSVLIFFRSVLEVNERFGEAMRALKPEGLLWLCYPKGGAKAGTDLNRDKGWDVVRAAGYEGVSLVSIDDTWSAMRFRPVGAGSKRKPASLEGSATADKSAKSLEVPADLVQALSGHHEAEQFFASLAPSHRKAYIEWIVEAKREDTRQRRVEQTLEKLSQGLKRPSDKV
ncbi:hypothetical protein D3C81_993940 [compost metagenome]